MQGVGYYAIAAELGLTRDGVRSYCKYHGLNGIPEVMERNIGDRVASGKACAQCYGPVKNPVIAYGRTFCCEKCRKAYVSVRRKTKGEV